MKLSQPYARPCAQDDLDPTWDQDFTIVVPSEGGALSIEIFDFDKNSKHAFLGKVQPAMPVATDGQCNGLDSAPLARTTAFRPHARCTSCLVAPPMISRPSTLPRTRQP